MTTSLKITVAFFFFPCYNKIMKNKMQPQHIKSFKYKFTKLLICLAIAVIALCSAGIGLSIYRIIAFGINGVYDLLKSPFLILVCVSCIVIVTSILIKSQYVVDDKNFTIQFGFIKNIFPIKEITSVLLNSDLKKLTVYIGEQFFVLSLSPEDNEELVKSLRNVNSNIDYSFTLSDSPDKKDD